MSDTVMIGFYNNESDKIFASVLKVSSGGDATGRSLLENYGSEYLAWQISGMGVMQALRPTYDETYDVTDESGIPTLFESIPLYLELLEKTVIQSVYLYDGFTWFVADKTNPTFTDVLTVISKAA